jgi:hypothetical protein
MMMFLGMRGRVFDFPPMRKGDREQRAAMKSVNRWRVLVVLTVNVAIGLLPAATHSHAWHHTVFLLLLDPRNEGVARKQKRGVSREFPK